MNYIVFDLEATCWEERNGRQNEVIEIGAVKIDDHQRIVDEFEQFVKPVINPELSDFCTELTSIKQDDIAQAPTFFEAAERFKEWIGWPDTEYILCSWGQYDKNQLRLDCQVHDMDNQWVEPHINLKKQYEHI